MAGNRLTGDGGERGPPAIGETRVYHGRNKAGDVTKTAHVTRTVRPYIEDLADAYTASINEDARQRGLIWATTQAGDLYLTELPEWSAHNAKRIERQREAERAQFIRCQLDNERGPAGWHD